MVPKTGVVDVMVKVPLVPVAAVYVLDAAIAELTVYAVAGSVAMVAAGTVAEQVAGLVVPQVAV
jgi:hypothetical protein